jgi:tripartite-type tricarboxylate transporter receptor subunit TctC
VTPAIQDAVGAQVHLVFSVIPAVLPTLKAGRLRALGVSSAQRTPLVPDLPTIAETVPGYEFIGWYSLVAPTRTPDVVLDKLNAQVVAALQTPEFQERFAALGAEPLGTTRTEAGRFIREQMEKMRVAVQTSGAKAD